MATTILSFMIPTILATEACMEVITEGITGTIIHPITIHGIHHIIIPAMAILTRNTLYLMAEQKEPAISQQGGQAVQPLLLLQREEIRTFPRMEQGRVPHRQYHLIQGER